MKITADTNVLLRVILDDDGVQQQVAVEALDGAELVAISVQSLCEFAWVLDRGYKRRVRRHIRYAQPHFLLSTTDL